MAWPEGKGSLNRRKFCPSDRLETGTPALGRPVRSAGPLTSRSAALARQAPPAGGPVEDRRTGRPKVGVPTCRGVFWSERGMFWSQHAMFWYEHAVFWSEWAMFWSEHAMFWSEHAMF
jgi:hypothetical protein